MQISSRTFWSIIAAGLVVGVGILACAWIRNYRELLWILVRLESLACIVWIGDELRRAARKPSNRTEKKTRQELARFPGAGAIVIWLGIVLLCASSNRERWKPQPPKPDDSDLYAASADWPSTRANLLVPYNEHLIVPARLLSYLVVRFSDEEGRDYVGAWASASLFLSALVLLFLLARREWNSDLAGLLAVTFFGLSTSYREVMLWYSASQWLFPVLLLLGSLLLAGGRDFSVGWRSILVSMLSFLGPFCYTIGLLVGPIASVWIAVRCRTSKQPRLRVIFAPTLATVAGLSICMPLLLGWMTSPEYAARGGRGFVFDPWGGMRSISQLVVDLLVLRNLGIVVPPGEPWRYVLVLPILASSIVWLLRVRPDTWRLLPFLLLVLCSYAMTIPFRTWVHPADLATWTRYQLFPQLGLALLLTGALNSVFPDLMVTPRGRLGLWQGMFIFILAIVSFWSGVRVGICQ